MFSLLLPLLLFILPLPLVMTIMADIVGGVTITNLPADPATGAKQDSGNALLTAIAGNVDGLEAGIGNPSDAPATSELQSAGTLGVLRGIWVEMRGIGDRLATIARAITRPGWFDCSEMRKSTCGSYSRKTNIWPIVSSPLYN